jgi:hypothetical protein
MIRVQALDMSSRATAQWLLEVNMAHTMRLLLPAALLAALACSSKNGGEEDTSTADALDAADEPISDVVPEPDCDAGPGILGVSGTFSPGSTVVLTGCTFGTKDPATPLLWDRVDNQEAYGSFDTGDTVPSGEGFPWMDNGEHTWVNNVKFYSGPEARYDGAWSYWIPSTEDPKGKGLLRGHDLDLPDDSDLYVSWWQKVDNCTPAEHASTGIFGLHAEDLATDGFMSCTLTQWTLTDAWVESASTFSAQHIAWWEGREPCDGTWSHYEVFVHYTAATDHGVAGLVTVMRDRTIRCASAISGDPRFCADRPFEAAGSLDQIRVLGLDIDEPDRASVEPTNTWLSEIYVDSTQARVVVGDSPRLVAVTHFELQPPISWSEEQIEIEVHRGSFLAGERAYLYVVDRDGVHNLEGYPIDWSD